MRERAFLRETLRLQKQETAAPVVFLKPNQAIDFLDSKEEDEARALADAIDAAADDALRGEGFIGSRELTSQLLQAADASRAPCRSPFAELGDGEGLPQQ